MARMRAVQVSRAGKDFEIVERNIPPAEHGTVRIRVEACGICHSDVFVKDGLFPGLEFPRIPGHEIVGRVDAVGDGVVNWPVGMRVGVGWHGGHCFTCRACRGGDFVNCVRERICGISFDGGYADFVVVPAEALVPIPEGVEASVVAPLLCAGLTSYNALKHSQAGPGDVVAVQGIGGLGHLALQYARKMGFHVVALSRGDNKRRVSFELGAHDYVDVERENPAEALRALGGATTILTTAPASAGIQALFDGLAPDGEVVVVGVAGEPLQVGALQLIMGRHSLRGWPSGVPRDAEATIEFSILSGVRPMVEVLPLERAGEAYRRAMANEARFRMVLTTDGQLS